MRARTANVCRERPLCRSVRIKEVNDHSVTRYKRVGVEADPYGYQSCVVHYPVGARFHARPYRQCL